MVATETRVVGSGWQAGGMHPTEMLSSLGLFSPVSIPVSVSVNEPTGLFENLEIGCYVKGAHYASHESYKSCCPRISNIIGAKNMIVLVASPRVKLVICMS